MIVSRSLVILILGLFAVLMFVAIAPVFGAEPQPGWVDKLTNGNGNVCCFNYDGQRLDDPEWEAGSTYKVAREGKMVAVPPWAVVTMKNQDGLARVWWLPHPDENGNMVRCFLPGGLA